MKCFKYYSSKNREGSQLYRDVLNKYGEEKVDHIYDEVIWSDSKNRNSFMNWINDQKDVLTTNTNEPSIIHFEEWMKYIKRRNRVKKTFMTNDFETTPTEFLSLSEGFTYFVIDKLFDKGNLTPDMLLTTTRSKLRNVLNQSIIELKQELTKVAKANPNKAERFNEIIKAIDSEPDLFYDSFNNYLRNKLKIKLNLDNILSDDIETKDDKTTKDSAFNKSSIEFDTKDGAPSSIKILIASLPQVTSQGTDVKNDLMLPSLVDYNDTFNFIQNKLAEIPGDINLFIDELKQHTVQHPELIILMRRLNFGMDEYTPPTNDTYNLINQTKLRTEFVNHFDKVKMDFTINILKEDGTISSSNANIDNLRNQILKDWKNNFEILKANNSNYLDYANDILYSDKKDLLNYLGITGIKNISSIDDEIINDIRTYGIEDDIENIYSPKKGKGVKNKLAKLAEISIKENADKSSFQLFNIDNKMIYGITLHSYITKLAKDLNYYTGNEEELVKRYPEIFNSDYSENSIFTDRIKEGNGIKIGINNGFKSDYDKSKGTPTKDLQEKDLILQRMVSVLKEGYYPFIRTADRGIENYVFFPGMKDKRLVTGKQDAKVRYKLYLKDELKHISNNKNIDVSTFDTENLRIFAYNDKNGVIHKLTDKISLNKLESFKGNDIAESKDIDVFIDNMIDSIIRIEKAFMLENGVIKESTGAFSKSDKSNYFQDLIDEEKGIDRVIELYALNSHVANIEITKLFTGDLGFYGKPSNVFKRMSMLNSTKENLRVDKEMNNIINNLENKFEDKNGASKNENLDDENTEMKTITIKDVFSDITKNYDKQTQDTFKALFKNDKNYLDLYKNIDETDSIAYVTLDEYRRLGIRSGEWNNKDEAFYNRLGEENYSYNANTVHKFTVKKYQYTGFLKGKGDIQIPALRKFVFMPLVPGLFEKGSVLERVNNEMLKNRVGMAFYESSTKDIGHTKNTHSLYDENGNFALDASINHDILDYKFLGNQLKIHSKSKLKVKGTQRDKVIMSNFYLNGKPMDEVKSLLEKYNNFQTERIQRAYKSLTDKIGIKPNEIVTEKDMENFVDSLINQGLSQNFTTGELEALELLINSRKFDILPNKTKIESLITSTLKNNAIDVKKKGGMFVQLPNTGFEIDGKTSYEDKHDLKFYRYALNKDGSLNEDRLLPMQIAVPLPNELIDYVSDVYNNGNGVTESALNDFNNDIAKDNKLYEENENHKSKLSRLTLYSAFRIPTQDMASLEAAKVKKFFMPHMTNMIVVPKAIVVKTGSDFDVDKITFYAPHIKVQRSYDNHVYEALIKGINLDKAKMRRALDIEYPGITALNVKDEFKNLILDIPASLLINEDHQQMNAFYKAKLKENQSKVEDFDIPEYEADDIENASKMELENQELSTEIELTLSKINHKKLLTPLNEVVIKNIVNQLRKDQGWTNTEIKEGAKDNIHEVFYGKKNIEKFITFLSGKNGVAQVAVQIPNHALAQKAGLEMKALHDYFGMSKDNYISLGKQYNKSEQLISEILSAMITSYVDIAKDPYILDINAVQTTANVILMLTRFGVDLNKIFYFINQPIIKDYLNQKKLNDAVTSKDGGKIIYPNQIIDKVLRKYGITNISAKDMIFNIEKQITDNPNNIGKRVKSNKYTNFTFEELQKGIRENAKNGIENLDSKVQLKSLEMFLEYDRQSRLFSTMIKSVSPDTSQFKNLSILKSQVNLRDKIVESDMFKNYNKMFDESFIGEYYNNKKQYLDTIKQFFLAQDDNYVETLDALKDIYTNRLYNDADKTRITNVIESEFINYILSKTGALNNEAKFSKLFKDGKKHISLPKIIKVLQTKFKEHGVNNDFLEELLPLINDREQGYDSMRFKSRKMTNDKIEKIKIGFEKLTKGTHAQFAQQFFNKNIVDLTYLDKKIWVYNMLQSGLNNSPFSLIKAISPRLHEQMLATSLDIAKKSPANIDVDTYKYLFIRNHLRELFRKSKKGLDFSVAWNKFIEDFEMNQEGKTYSSLGSYNRINYPKENLAKIKNISNPKSSEINDAFNEC